MHHEHKNTSKFMSLLLRHKPKTIGLELDECGWANIDELIALSAKHGKILHRDLIAAVVAESDKQRFSISDCGNFVRANQGHSFPVELNLEPEQPATLAFPRHGNPFSNQHF